MHCKLTAAALAVAFLLAGCSSSRVPTNEPDIIAYEATLDRVHVRDDSLSEYASTRAGAGIRQGEEYVHTLWGEHEAGLTDADKLALYYGEETARQRDARLAKERVAREAAKARATKSVKMARAKSRNRRDRSIYAEDMDQSIYSRRTRAQGANSDNSVIKKFVEKTVLRKNETMKQAAVNAPSAPIASEGSNTQAAMFAAPGLSATQTPASQASAVPVVMENVKTSASAKAEKTKTVELKHVIDPVVKNAQIPIVKLAAESLTAPAQNSASATATSTLTKEVMQATEADGKTASARSGDASAAGAVLAPVLKDGNP